MIKRTTGRPKVSLQTDTEFSQEFVPDSILGQDAAAVTNKDILLLLQKLSAQLESMQSAPATPNQNNNAGVAPTAGQQQTQSYNSIQQPAARTNQELQELFKQILNAKTQTPSVQGQDMQQQQQQAKQLREQQAQQTKAKDLTVQTAAQVLAQAQYELSTELEMSLQKLKKVISESEKLANKISNLLGEENQSSK